VTTGSKLGPLRESRPAPGFQRRRRGPGLKISRKILPGKFPAGRFPKISQPDFPGKNLSDFFQKNFREKSGNKNFTRTHQNEKTPRPSQNHPPKPPSKSTLQPHQSGHASAPVSPKFPNKAQTEPRFNANLPLFDRKLLEELHEQGVRNISRNSRRCQT
jgi:hypothetical protein